MLSRLLFVTGLLLCAVELRAQVYEPGFLVRSGGDTLRGEIENAFWTEPPRFVYFRTTSSASSEAYLPKQLQAFGLTAGRYFRLEALPIDHAARAKVGDLPYDNRTEIRVDTVLAEVLIDGDVKLERVQLPQLTHYFLLRPNQPTLDLSERKYLRKSVDGAWRLTDGNNYHGQLAVYFGDCAAAHAAAQQAPFTAQGLAAVVETYNKTCAPTSARPNRNLFANATAHGSIGFQGGVLGGVRYNRIESNAIENAGPCVDCRPHPFAGFYAELLQPGRTLALYGEITLSNFNGRGAQFQGHTPMQRDVYLPFDYKAWLVTSRLGIRLFAPLPHEQQLLFGLGYELNFMVSPTVTTPTGTWQTAPLELGMGYAKTTMLPYVGLGWRNQRFSVFADGQMYENTVKDANDSSTFFGNNFTTRLGVSYRLGRPADAKPSAK